MITPAYAPTATERVLPRMALDFTTGVLDPRVTVARLLNTATCVNSSGFIEIVNANLPRFDYDSVTLIPKGLLIEEARTNSLLWSEEFNQATWLKFDSSASQNAATAPNNTLTADKFVEGTGASIHRFNQAGIIVSGQTYTLSVFAKKEERSRVMLRTNNGSVDADTVFDLDAGTVVSGVGTIQAYRSGWYRLSRTFTAAASTTSNFISQILLVNTGSNTSYQGIAGYGLYLWGADLELGAFATSYIPTTTLAVLRNADVVTMTGTNFSSWYNQTEGTFVVEGSGRIGAGGSAALMSTLSAPSRNISPQIDILSATSTRSVYTDASMAIVANISVTVASTAATNKYAAAVSASGVALVANGGTVSSSAITSVPTPTLLSIGGLQSTQFLNGYARGIRYYPIRLTNAQLQAFSK